MTDGARRRVVLAAAASRNLNEARVWLTQPGSGRRALARLNAIKTALRDLRRAPCMWPLGEIAGTRERVVADHVIVYRVEPDTGDSRTAGDVVVLRIFGPGQDRSGL